MTDKPVPIHLVLGSGGARGLTHIGVIKVLHEYGYKIESITGCSMGALVGALLVSGHLDAFEAWVRQLTRWDVLRFLDVSILGRAGMVKGDKLMERLAEWLSGVQMEEMPIPLTVVAADIASRKEVWIARGDLLEAVRASIAVPGVFTPLVTHGRVLVDGGILNPLPIPPARIENRTITVAVSLSGREVAHPFGDPPQPEIVKASKPLVDAANNPGLEEEFAAVGHQPIEGFLDSLQHFFGRERRSADSAGESEDSPENGKGPTSARMRIRRTARPALTDVMLSMFNTMQNTIARHQLAGNPPDILIDIPCNICESHDFHMANELIPAGAYWARRALEDQRENGHH